MNILQSALTMLALGATVLAHGTTAPTVHSQTAPGPAAPTATRTVTVVKSKAPWYAFDFLLAREYAKLLPVYQKVDGLRFKAFSTITTPAGKFFGGIYQWKSEAQARAWYSPTWFADVERKRGHRPSVDYYPLVAEAEFVPAGFNYHQGEGDCVTVFVHALRPTQRPACLQPQPGLRRSYVVAEAAGQEGALLLFATAAQATAFLHQQQLTAHDWFQTPVLLNNAR